MFARFRAFRTCIGRRSTKKPASPKSTESYHTGNGDVGQITKAPDVLDSSGETYSNSEYFHYTSGRWLYNEPLRLAERTLFFNIQGLQEVAAKAINKTANDVAAFQKLAEGGFNRTFMITMRSGEEVIARLPYPVAFPARFTVASEVATLGLVKLNGIPVPSVLDYSTTKENPVGAEYIIMEKARGVELGDRWYSLPDEDRASIIGRLSKIEQKLFSIPLPASGSIFYKRDMDPSIRVENIPETDLCVGPSVEQRWWHDRRDGIRNPGGPFLNAEEYLRAGAEKELAWLKAYGRPTFPALQYREFTDYQKSDPAEQTASLEQYLKVVPYLAPTLPEHQYLLRPTIRHPDINPRNIFVDDDLQISSLIDWQHSSAVPLFLQAGIPDCFVNLGDEESMQLKKPVLPENLSTLSEAEREEEMNRYRQRYVHFYYFAGAYNFNKDHYKALRLSANTLRQRLCFNASVPWHGNNIPLKAILMEAVLKWDVLTSGAVEGRPPCPISFTDSEMTDCFRINAAQESVDENIDQIRNRIAISSDGWTALHLYEHAVNENAAVKAEALENETEDEKELLLRHWPFDDHAEDGLS